MSLVNLWYLWDIKVKILRRWLGTSVQGSGEKSGYRDLEIIAFRHGCSIKSM